MKPPPFGETTKERATYLMWAFNNDLNSCNKHCDTMIAMDYTPSFYEKVKIELKNIEICLIKIFIQHQKT